MRFRKLHFVHFKGADSLHFHQSDPREDRSDVWQSGDTPGGKALKFYASVRVDIRRIGAIKNSDGTVTATAPRSKSSRTRSPRPSPRRSSTSCITRGFPASARCSISLWKKASSKSGAHGSATRGPSWRKAATLPRRSCEATQRSSQQIDQDVRSRARFREKAVSRRLMPTREIPPNPPLRKLGYPTLLSSAIGFLNPGETLPWRSTFSEPPEGKGPTKRWPQLAPALV